ncbi:MAG: AI-2E family transporter [Gemmataceae bacterium]
MQGTRRLPRTQALDDAGRRISSFLLMQLAVNLAFGVLYGLGLFLIGVPYPVLGGFLGGLMRYIPFIGSWVAGAGPALLSIALLPGWWHLGAVVALTAALELTFAQMVEPIAFGRSIGVSEVALLVALAFWGWLWGVAGMILATPLTACLVVMSRHVPQLRFLARLLGDEPALPPAQSLYQRLLAKDTEEAEQLLEAHRAEAGSEDVYADLLLPALRLAKRHRDGGQIKPEEEAEVYRQVRELLPTTPVEPATADEEACRVVGFPAGEEANELALELFARLLPRHTGFEVSPATALTAELVDPSHEVAPGLIVLGTVMRDSLRQTRLLVKRLRKECPRAKVLVGWWGGRLSAAQRQRLLEAGADGVARSFADARAQLTALRPVAREAAREEAVAS